MRLHGIPEQFGYLETDKKNSVNIQYDMFGNLEKLNTIDFYEPKPQTLTDY